MSTKHIPGLPRLPKVTPPSVVPTDIVKMICKDCGKVYTRKSGLMINGKLSLREGALVVKPCVAQPRLGSRKFLETDEDCGSTSYHVYRLMEVKAMPIGRVPNDLSRKHS
jgi:hypothetical protein